MEPPLPFQRAWGSTSIRSAPPGHRPGGPPRQQPHCPTGSFITGTRPETSSWPPLELPDCPIPCTNPPNSRQPCRIRGLGCFGLGEAGCESLGAGRRPVWRSARHRSRARLADGSSRPSRSEAVPPVPADLILGPRNKSLPRQRPITRGTGGCSVACASATESLAGTVDPCQTVR